MDTSAELKGEAIRALAETFAANGCARSLDHPTRYLYSLSWVPAWSSWVLPHSKYTNTIRANIIRPLAFQCMYRALLNAPAITHDMTSVYSVVTAGQLQRMSAGEIGELNKAINDNTWRSYLAEARCELWSSTLNVVSLSIGDNFPGLPDHDAIAARWSSMAREDRLQVVQIAASIADYAAPVSFNDCLAVGYDAGVSALVYVILQDAGIVAPCDYARAIKVRS